MTEDPGVMGNLPRSRPGRRSDKRAASGAGAKGAKSTKAAKGGSRAGGGGAAKASKPRTAGAGSRGGASRSGGSSTRAGTARPGGATRQPRREHQPAASAPDPIGGAVRVAAKVAGAGIGVAAGILRRLPRP